MEILSVKGSQGRRVAKMHLFNMLTKIGIFLMRRVVALYLVLILLSFIIIDTDAVRVKAKAAALSRLRPSFDYFVETVTNRRAFDKTKLGDYQHYYEKVVEYMPTKADGYGMLGFCYYHMEMPKKAIACYQKAAQLNNDFFWFYYNLGMIHFKGGYYKEAVGYLREAVAKDLSVTMNLAFTSRIYREADPQGAKDFVNHQAKKLRNGYRSAYILMILSYYHLEDFLNMSHAVDKAIDASVDDWDLLYYRGLASYKLGAYTQAVLALEEYAKKRPGSTEALYYLGLCLKAMGQKIPPGAIQNALTTKMIGLPPSIAAKESEIGLESF